MLLYQHIILALLQTHSYSPLLAVRVACFLWASKSVLHENIIWKGSWTEWSNDPFCTWNLDALVHYLTGRLLSPPYALTGSLWVGEKEGLCGCCIWWQTLNTFQHTCALRLLKWGRGSKGGRSLPTWGKLWGFCVKPGLRGTECQCQSPGPYPV